MMKKLRHFVGDCIRFVRKIKAMTIYYTYRYIGLPTKSFLKKYVPDAVRIRTSGSDVKSYRDICRLASQDEIVFSTFRVHKDYGYNLGEWQNDTRKIALDIIQNEYPDLLAYTKKFEESEKFGGPVIHKTEIGNLSDPTIRYIRTLGNIKTQFGPLDNFNIIEIGAGYGGQCKITSDVFKFTSYTLVDLPEVLGLDKKFLTKLNVQNVRYMPPNEVPETGSYDLIISNFAFAECERTVQQVYIDRIIKNAKHGFITYNFDGHPSQDYNPIRPYYKEEIINIIGQHHKLTVLDDYPHPDHCQPFIMVWDDTKQ